MPKMTKSQIAASLAEKAGIKKKQASLVMEELANLAYKEAKNTFVVPGLGKLVLVNRPARKMIMRFGPKVGQEIMVPAKKVVKFRLAKAAKDAILKK
ncbi:MAG: HU family DNA-binding protein [Verrucomicrobia bacterium]|nr:HU family DNA-binding protein [Verrucomicrobiota bacterium]